MWPPMSVPHQCVSHERIDGNVIAVNLESGTYFSMTGTGADVWTAASSGLAAHTWLAVLDDAYGRECPRQEIGAFLTACLDQQLLVQETTPADGPLTLPEDVMRTTWSAPRLEIFEDLRDLLLVDPVHDTSTFGWPNIERLDD